MQVEDKTVGMAYLARGKFEKNKHVASLGITILKGFRRMGIGTAMMNRLLKWAQKQKGVEKISLDVFSTNKPAINLYRKLGFETKGTRRRQYKIGDKYIDEVTMAKFLQANISSLDNLSNFPKLVFHHRIVPSAFSSSS